MQHTTESINQIKANSFIADSFFNIQRNIKNVNLNKVVIMLLCLKTIVCSVLRALVFASCVKLVSVVEEGVYIKTCMMWFVGKRDYWR